MEQDQLKLLDDIGFSSAVNQKTVVPKSGTVMFVMFVPAKPFEQGWWTQPCAETLSNRITFNPDPKADPNNNATGDGSDTGSTADKTSDKIKKKLGIDLKQAFDNCSPKANRGLLEESAPGYPTNGTAATYKHFREIPYKKWSPNADALFRELVFTVISGIHIQETSQTKPAVTAVNSRRTSLETSISTSNPMGRFPVMLPGIILIK